MLGYLLPRMQWRRRASEHRLESVAVAGAESTTADKCVSPLQQHSKGSGRTPLLPDASSSGRSFVIGTQFARNQVGHLMRHWSRLHAQQLSSAVGMNNCLGLLSQSQTPAYQYLQHVLMQSGAAQLCSLQPSPCPYICLPVLYTLAACTRELAASQRPPQQPLNTSSPPIYARPPAPTPSPMACRGRRLGGSPWRTRGTRCQSCPT